ncbi:MAG: xanthine dehydrogenase family protein molybdopterin-binding subunit [Acidobacteria bacterium]|nr:xanthine dehydrogenase family protein molybdopterin-binding subunit [Acidobacteriota bacterium]
MAKVLTRVELNGVVNDVWVEVPENEPAAWPKQAELAVLGKPLPRVDGPDKVSGRAKYTHDVNLSHMLWMKFFRSPYPHARITSLDTSRAEALPGVKRVYTYENTPDISWYANRSKLFDTTLRFVGDEVAAVVAVDEHIAADALPLIDVEYEEMPYVLDAETALSPDAPAIHEGGPQDAPGARNLQGGRPSLYTRGDVEKGFAEADFVIEHTFRSPCQVHACLETHCSVAAWQGDKLTVWDSTQAVHPVRESLAQILNIPIANIRVICLYSGGGFGSKLWINKYTVLAALAARDLGRPVKVTLDREEDALAMGNRPANVMTIRAGCKRDGTLTALTLKNIGSVGAYNAGAGVGTPLREVYRCPNVSTEESNVYINADVARPHRAPGHVQGTWGLEQVLDILAEKCGLDPLDFRLRNYSDTDQVRNLPYSTKGLREAYEKGAEKFGWRDRTARQALSRGPKKRGFGLATQIWGGAGGPPGYAVVNLYSDGTAAVFSGGQDIGSATRTSMLQVAAEELGLPADKLSIVMGDTQGTPYGFVSGGSRTTPSQAPAVRMAAAEVKGQLLELAGKQMNLPAQRLSTREGYVFDTQNPSTRKPIAEVTKELQFGFGTGDRVQNMLIGKGWRGPNPADVSVNSWGAQFAEVEVDIETGEIRVLRIVAAHEAGRLVNPLTASSQIEGGVIQGLGFALFEERVLNNASGRMVNANLHDYKIPTMKDIPEIESVLIDLPDARANSVGVKGLGEPPIIPTPGAIANAVADALGVRVFETPMTPQRVLEALEKGLVLRAQPEEGRRA